MSIKSPINFKPADAAWADYESYLKSLIIEHGIKSICDIGGGANPALSLDFIREHQLDYSVLDISQSELEKAPTSFVKIYGDICNPNLNLGKTFDLVFSKMLLEHVSHARAAHQNVHRLLNDRGIAFHFIPTLYALPFLINKLIPERLSRAILHSFSLRDRVQQAKFPAFYQWCRGPSRKQLRRFEKLNYSLVEYRGFFGHGYYIKMPFLHRIQMAWARFLLKHPMPAWTSYAYIVLRKQIY